MRLLYFKKVHVAHMATKENNARINSGAMPCGNNGMYTGTMEPTNHASTNAMRESLNALPKVPCPPRFSFKK
jgi:hypothetical protein